MKKLEEIARRNILRMLKPANKMGMTQKELATKAKIDPIHFNKSITGGRKLTEETVRLVAPALGVSPEDLYETASIKLPPQIDIKMVERVSRLLPMLLAYPELIEPVELLISDRTKAIEKRG